MYDRLVELSARNRAHDMTQQRRDIYAAKEELRAEVDRQRAEMAKAEEARKSWKNTLMSALPGLLSAGAGAALIPFTGPVGGAMMAGGLAGALGESINTRNAGPFQSGALTQLGTGLGAQVGGALYGAQGAQTSGAKDALAAQRAQAASPSRGLSAPMNGPGAPIGSRFFYDSPSYLSQPLGGATPWYDPRLSQY